MRKLKNPKRNLVEQSKENKPELKIIEEERPKIRGKRLWKACALAILHFLWLYKITKNYR